MVVCFAPRKNIKVISFNVMSSGYDVVSFSKKLKVFGFPIMNPSFNFSQRSMFVFE